MTGAGDRYDDLLNRLEGIIKILRLYPDLKHPNPDKNTNHSAYINVLLHNWNGQKVSCDITHSYALVDRPTIDQMACIGNAKFVDIMRDPISRAWSEVRMQLRLDPKYNGVSDVGTKGVQTSPLNFQFTIDRLTRRYIVWKDMSED